MYFIWMTGCRMMSSRNPGKLRQPSLNDQGSPSSLYIFALMNAFLKFGDSGYFSEKAVESFNKLLQIRIIRGYWFCDFFQNRMSVCNYRQYHRNFLNFKSVNYFATSLFHSFAFPNTIEVSASRSPYRPAIYSADLFFSNPHIHGRFRSSVVHLFWLTYHKTFHIVHSGIFL